MLKMSMSLGLSLFASLAVSLAFGTPGLPRQHRVATFDKPLKVTVVDFGASPYYRGPNVPRVKLSCYSYPTVAVKEYDEGQKGAEWISIAAIGQDVKAACEKTHVQGERVIEAGEWSGYFKGAKENLVFLKAADGTDGGLPFAVYDVSIGKKIFEDSAYDSSMWSRKVAASPFNHMRVSQAADGQISLKYLRVTRADCDLKNEATTCWQRVEKKLGLVNLQIPACGGYKDNSTRADSAIAYPVEVFLAPQPVVETIRGPLHCWPVD